MGIAGEPSQTPADPRNGLVWSAIFHKAIDPRLGEPVCIIVEDSERITFRRSILGRLVAAGLPS